jgi:hypothetical protein
LYPKIQATRRQKDSCAGDAAEKVVAGAEDVVADAAVAAEVPDVQEGEDKNQFADARNPDGGDPLSECSLLPVPQSPDLLESISQTPLGLRRALTEVSQVFSIATTNLGPSSLHASTSPSTSSPESNGDR